MAKCYPYPRGRGDLKTENQRNYIVLVQGFFSGGDIEANLC